MSELPRHPDRRAPTAEEARALAHPLRLRILFACRQRGHTNKELAAELDTTPGTIHYHLKPLVEQGFLEPEAPRAGRRGSTEQPYRATGKSWELSGRAPGTEDHTRVLREVGAEEVLSAREEDVVTLSRLGMTLSEDHIAELDTRLGDLIDEFAARSRVQPDVDGVDVTLFVALQRARQPDHPSD